jgi:hypothetical protein
MLDTILKRTMEKVAISIKKILSHTNQLY